MIIEKDKLLSKKASIAEVVINNYFLNILERLHLKDPPESYVDNIGNNILHSFRDHISVKNKGEKTDDGVFYFQRISTEEP